MKVSRDTPRNGGCYRFVGAGVVLLATEHGPRGCSESIGRPDFNPPSCAREPSARHRFPWNIFVLGSFSAVG